MSVAHSARLPAPEELIARMAHELRTPLTPILGWCRLVAEKYPNDASVQRAASVIERNVRIQARLVDDLLDVVRIERGAVELTLERLDLRRLSRSVLDDAERSLQHPLTLSEAHAPEPVWVDGDEARLRQAIGRLVDNAVKFTGPHGRIEVAAACAGNRARLVVSDNGVGIAPELLPFVFEMYAHRSAPGPAARGLGAGLVLARYFVERHGGTIEAESAGVGRGARFTVYLPGASAP